MKKLINLIALVMLVSTNVLTPFSYAQVENLEVIPGSEVETVEEGLGETEEIPEISEEIPEANPEEKGELEQGRVEDEAPENVLPNVQDDEETPVTDETEEEDTENDEVVQPVEEISENEIQDEGEKFEELEKKQEMIVMDIIPNTTAILLPGQEFNATIKRLAGQSSATYSTTNTTINQIIQWTGDTIPSGVTTVGISTSDSEKEIIAWFTGGIVYYSSEAETIYTNPDSSYMFYFMQGLTGLDLSNWDTSNVTNMKYLFYSLHLRELNLSGWDFSRLTHGFYAEGLVDAKKINMQNTKFSGSMAGLFFGSNSLEEINMSGADTSSVIDMSYMFTDCRNLTSLNFNGWDTSNVKKMDLMFEECDSLKKLDLSNFDTSSLTSMRYMFDGCKLEELDLSNFDTSNVTDITCVFCGLENLTKLNLSGWDFRKSGIRFNQRFGTTYSKSLKQLNMTNTKFSGSVTYAFGLLRALDEINLSGADMSQVTDMSQMFSSCENLREIKGLETWDTSNVTNMSQMFQNCSSLTGLDLSSFDTSSVTRMSDIFRDCSSLEEINLSGWDFRKHNSNASLMMTMTVGLTPSLKKLNMTNTKYTGSASYAFGGLTKLEELNLDGADTRGVTNMQAMFYGDNNLKDLDLSSFDTSKVTSMQSMFNGCSGLESLNLDNWIINGDSNTIGGMFGGANKLKTLSMRNWTIPETFTNAIGGRTSSLSATGIETIDVSNWNFSGTNNLHGLFGSLKTKEIKGLDTWDTSGIQIMSEMFYGCSNLTGLNIKNWDVSSVTGMNSMFHSCSNLMNLDLGGWNTSNVTNVGLLLFGCSKLEGNLSGRDFRNAYVGNGAFGLKKLNLTNAKFSGSMNRMFEVSPLEQIIFDGVDTSNVTSMDSMFNLCSVTELDLSSFDTSNVIDMDSVFINTHLKKLNLSGWNFKNIRFSIGNLGMYSMYSQLEELNLTNAIFSGSMYEAFHAISPIDRIILDGVDTSKVTDMGGMFSNQTKLTGLNLSSFDTSNVTNMSQMFYYCSNLEELNLSSFDTSNVTNMSQMFNGCSNLTGLDLSNFDTSNLNGEWWNAGLNGIFAGCSKLEEINLSGWDFRNVSTNMMNMTAGGNSSIKILDITNVKYGTNMNQAFAGLRNLEEIKGLDTVDTRNVVDMSMMFNGCSKLGQLDLSNFNTSNVRNMTQMFFNCSGMQKLDLSNFDTSNVTNMFSMFYNTPNLKTIYASNKFVTTALSGNNSSKDMFSGTTSVVGGNGTKFDPNYIDEEYAKIDKVGQTGYFTDKNAINVKFINTLDGRETTSTFAKGQKLTPPSVNGYHVAGGYLDEAMTQKIDLNKGVDSYTVIYVKYDHNGSSGGGGGGGSSKKTDEDTHGSAEDSQKNTQDDKNTENVIQNETKGSEESSNTPMDSSDKSSEGQEILSPSDSSFTKEQKDAYTFAKGNGITTMPTIQKANMEGKLTRIAMAKMLSQYAINVLGKTPDTSKTIKFKDVTSKKDADYDNGVTLAYQLGIMGQNMPGNNFRPNDEVTRAEFATALSRMAYNTSDGEYKSTSKYYTHHMEKLVNEGIITNDNPNMKELRGYVMIMLMRSTK